MENGPARSIAIEVKAVRVLTSGERRMAHIQVSREAYECSVAEDGIRALAG